MKEIVKVKLDNEMDVILAHKRAMKLAELCGCSLVGQTSFATAVSEIARCALDSSKGAVAYLGVESAPPKKYIASIVKVPGILAPKSKDSLVYARRLVEDLKLNTVPRESQISIRFPVSFGGIITDQKVATFKEYFEKEPPLSAYDELRRKNQLLQDLAEKIRETESEYKFLSDHLPLMMFSANNRGQVVFTNRWLQDFFSPVPKELSSSSWHSSIHEQDLPSFSKEMNSAFTRQLPLTGQYRIRQKNSSNYLWHMFSLIPLKNDKDVTTSWMGFLVDVHAQKLIEQALKDNRELKETQAELFRYQDELERKVIELNRSNYELEQFAHLASHDLQEPLRKLFFYSDLLKKRYGASLDGSGVSILNNMTHAAARMKELIQDLLSYSQLHKQKLVMEEVELQSVMEETLRDLEVNIQESEADIQISALPAIRGNHLRLRQLFTNLISNSLKYSRKEVKTEISVHATRDNDDWIIKVRDNGIGFDPQFSEKIFGLFERLHSRDEFPGTGIGLSICRKIVELHGGTISAYSRQNEFAVFEIRFPEKQQSISISE